MGSRSGQVTVFIIVGLLALGLIAAGIVLLKKEGGEGLTELPQAEQVSREFEPVKLFVEDCLEKTATEGLERIGETGGYAQPERVLQMDNRRSVPTESQAVFFDPSDSFAIPYWYYSASENACEADCVFGSQRPDLTGGSRSIQGQLQTYIEQHLSDCLGNFRDLTVQGFAITALADPQVQVGIIRGRVLARMELPLEISKGDAKDKVQQFLASIDVDLFSIYELATNLTRLEAEHHYLEKHIRNIIDVYTGLDPDKLPPVSGIDTEIGPGTTWVKYLVGEQVTRLMQIYIPYLRVTGTRNFAPVLPVESSPDPELISSVMNRGMIIPFDEDLSQYEVRFTYLDWWPLYFDLNCRGQLCQGESTLNTMGLVMGLQRYNFAYDVSLPVLVELKQPGALNGRGFSFRYFIEANMRNNEPLTRNYREFVLPQPDVTGTLLCDPSQWTGGVVSINVSDRRTGRPADAPIMYACGDELCGIGTAENGTLITKLPRCLGGTLIAQAADFTTVGYPLDVLDTSPQRVNFEVDAPYRVKVDLRKLRIAKTNAEWVSTGAKSVLSDGEEVVMILVRDEAPGGSAIPVVGNFYGGLRGRRDTTKELDLHPGNYTLSGTLISRPPRKIIIYPSVQCFSTGAIGFDQECITIPETPIEFNKTNPIIVGGAELRVEITEDMLQDPRGLLFTIIGLDFQGASDAELLGIKDLEEMGKVREYSQLHQEQLAPEIKVGP